MAQKNKETLKNYFKKGSFITEKEFIDLIDSSMNVIDDGISIKPEDGLRLNPTGIFSKLISFYKKKSQKKANFSININHSKNDGLSLNDENDKPIIMINKENKVGIITKDPKYDLDVNGTLGVNTRVGTFKDGCVPANGEWHKIISNLDGINAFEIISHVSGERNSGNYCLSHAIALSTFGGKFSNQKIKVLNANWGLFNFRNKIKLKWSGDLHNYNLEIKTTKNWGIDLKNNEFFNLNFNVTKLN
jgi:hypothetical protein